MEKIFKKYFYKMNFSFDDRPQNGNFMQKFDFKISIYLYYRDAHQA
ncbi:hypothetical protein LEP1GSC070_3527 [Leptospira santarosai str. AIM]|nr:hypothetical protein LEP1GSC070_3527 [Leptospira santarosai str. AIM]